MTPLVWFALALVLAAGGFLLAIVAPRRLGRAMAFGGVTLGGIAATASGVLVLVNDADLRWSGDAATHVALRLDPLAAAFVMIIGGVATIAGLFAMGGKTGDEAGRGRTAGCAACLILVASLLICVADDALFFIFAWELLALAFYVAIAYASTNRDAPRAAYLTALLTHAAGAGLVAAFVLLSHGGGLGLSSLLANAAMSSDLIRGLAFVLVLVAFGAKVGLLPFSIWVARGYTAAPAVVVALMAGGALNVGFYGLARFGLGVAGPIPLWWAIATLACGALAAFFGIAWASAQRDARTLAAYSSVENAGIVVIALGVSFAGRALGFHLLVGIGVAAALVHAAAHAFAKCALFLGCSELATRVGTTSFDSLGGLARRLPVTTIAVLAAGVSLAALPPSGGFAGEWMTLEALLQAFRSADVTTTIAFALCGATIGVAAGISIVAFVKVIGIGFLGAARSDAAASARASGSRLRGLGLLLAGGAALGVGIAAPSYVALVGPVIDRGAHAYATAAILAEVPLIQPAFHGFSSVWPLGLGILIAAFAIGFAVLVAVVRRPATVSVPVWTSGNMYRSWTQYTGTGFANPTRVVLDAGVRVRRDIAVEAELAGGSRRISYVSDARALFGVRFWNAIGAAFERVSEVVRSTQSGVIAAYLSYILAFVILLLVAFPSIRRW